MINRRWILCCSTLVSCLLISACEKPPAPIVAESRPVKTMVIGGSQSGDTRTFPAVVDAIQKADISFRVSGKVEKILVREGDQVKKGDVLAKLDPTDFEIKLRDRQASYDTAKANYDRAKKLVAKGAISKVDHDNIRATFHTAKANLKEAQQDLEYTKLKANFDGYIAKRYIENYEEVLGSQKIFSLEDVSALKLIIDVPENLMISIDKSNKDSDVKRSLHADFDSIKDQHFPLHFVEATTKADPTTRTFKVTLRMDAPKEYNILPGMTATVSAELFQQEAAITGSVALPVSAVVADNKKHATVWVVDETTMTVHPEPVDAGLLTGDSILVDGLTNGERIVIAGAAFLRDGMKVTLLNTGEQPE